MHGGRHDHPATGLELRQVRALPSWMVRARVVVAPTHQPRNLYRRVAARIAAPFPAPLVALAMLVASVGLVDGAQGVELVETPSLIERVETGEVPPVHQRVPRNPRVVGMDGETREPGRHGGQWRMLIHRSKDVKLFSVYGYARLVCYDENLTLVPDVAEEIIVEDARIFTIKLRQGHRWSDGHLFTSADFEYYWKHVALNDELSPSGPSQNFYVDGELLATGGEPTTTSTVVVEAESHYR